MLLKILGAAAIMAASVLAGFYFAMRDGYRIAQLTQMKKALTILMSEIRFSNALPDAAHNVSERVSGIVSDIFSSFSIKMLGKNGDEPCCIWESALNSSKTNSYFNTHDLDMLASLGKTFGYLDKEMQIDSIGLVISQIDAETKILMEKRDKNKRMYLNLGILGGLCVVITLL